MHTYACIHTHIHTHTHSHIHTHIHTHTCTHPARNKHTSHGFDGNRRKKTHQPTKQPLEGSTGTFVAWYQVISDKDLVVEYR